jgi:formate dehydrogenase/NADH-quinone oxidoreductase subunit F
MRLIGHLNEIQAAHGYLTEEPLRELAREAKVPLHCLQGLVSFYPHFRTKPPPRTEVAVCRDMCCWLTGGEKVCARLRADLAGTPDTEVHEVSCCGLVQVALNPILSVMKHWPAEVFRDQ